MQSSPLFFQSVPKITLYDPLSEVLGAVSEGIVQYDYNDVVKLAGHSCPTVAGVYLMLLKGLTLLYNDKTPVRGEIRVLMQGNLGEGVVGVMANIASLITGATDKSGFHGLGGKYDRRGLLEYGAQIKGEIALERIDTGERVHLSYNPKIVAGDPRIQEWLGMILADKANFEIEKSFQNAWQDRVKSILLDYVEHPGLITYIIEEKK